jgi:NADPH2:quinone reductase
MRAVVISTFGGPEVLELREVPDPVPGPNEVLVRVAASALNRADLLQRRGAYPAPPDAPQSIPGLEFAGEVEACGDRCTVLKAKDRVMGVVGGGAYAEKLIIHERAAVRIPEGMDWPQAACIPEAFLTAFDALFLQCGLAAGERVLIHAVGSGVGTAAVQLARAAGAFSIGTARSQEKLDRARELGLDRGVLVGAPRFADEVRRLTGGAGADLILDLVGGAYLEENLKAIAPRGRHIVVGLVAGATATIPLGLLLNKRVQLRGTVLRSRPLEEKIAAAQAFARQVVPLFERGLLRPVVDAVLPMTRVREAHQRMEANATFGKVALVW